MNKKIKDYILGVGGFDDPTNWERPGLPALVEQVKSIAGDGSHNFRTAEEVGRYMAQGGTWAVYSGDARRDLLEIFGIEGDWDRYCEEVGRAVGRLYKEGGAE